MGKRWIAIALLAASATFAEENDQPAGAPSHKGQPLAHWVDRLVKSLRANGEHDPEMEEALMAIGAPAVPVVVRRWFAERAELADPNSHSLAYIARALSTKDKSGLVEVLRSGRSEEKIVALEAWLLLVPPPEGWQSAADSMLNSDDDSLRLRTAYLLSIRDQHRQGVLQVLFDRVDRKDESLDGLDAVYALGKHPNHADVIVPRLKGLLDGSQLLALRAYATLGALAPHSQAARAILLRAYRSNEPIHRRGFVRAVQNLKAPTRDEVRRVLSLVGDQDARVNRDAMWLVRRRWWAAKEPVGLIDEAFAHPNRKLRLLACNVAARSTNPPLEGLILCLDDEREDVAAAARASVKQLIEKRTSRANHLLELARNRDHPRYIKLLWLLLRAGQHDAPKLLVRLGQAIPVALAIGPEARFAADELGTSKDPDAALALYLATGRNEEMFERARSHLQQGIPSGCDLAVRIGRDAVPLAAGVIKMIDSPARRTKNQAIAAAGAIGLPAAEPAIEKLEGLLDGHRRPTHSPPFVTARRAAATLALLGVHTAKVDAILRNVVEQPFPHDEHVWAGALRHHWVNKLMPVEEVVKHCLKPPKHVVETERVPLILLLTEIGPEAKAALPWLEKVEKERRDYLVTRAARRALTAIRGN
ncbi:MAG: hypothetical protein V3T86_09515 [Planctomycetota bacterium]